MVIPVDNEGFLDLRPPTWHWQESSSTYGIHTSYKAWEFIRLEELDGKADGSVDTAKYSIAHSQIFDLMKSN